MDLHLAGRRVIVTGAGRGIGRAVAHAFAREGARLHLVSRGAKSLEAVAAELTEAGVDVTTQALDTGKSEAANLIAAAAPDAEVLVNNAGGIPRGSILSLDENTWRSAWDPKVFGYVALMRRFVELMRTRGRGVVINIVGIGAERVEYDYASGSAGNAALAALTRAVGSQSVDYGVRVLAVHPGWADTDRSRSFLRESAQKAFGDPERWADVLAHWGLQRLVPPEEIADLVTFLASPRAGAVSGSVVLADGGFAARSYPPLPKKHEVSP